MRIFEDPMDQCLLCVGDDSRDDSPRGREAALRSFQPGVRLKEGWRYRNTYLGLRTLVAYAGSHPIGQIEFMPIEQASAPVDGGELIFINCLCVAPRFRRQGVGRALLAEAEHAAHKMRGGVAVVASRQGPAMPADFFLHSGYQRIALRGEDILLDKPLPDAEPPSFLPRRPTPACDPERVTVDVFACPQCPRNSWTLDRLRSSLQQRPGVVMRVFDTSERRAIRRWGLAWQILVDGEPITLRPSDPGAVLAVVDRAIAKRAASIRTVA
jgi:GNAT superfamily N-acetyltransferase